MTRLLAFAYPLTALILVACDAPPPSQERDTPFFDGPLRTELDFGPFDPAQLHVSLFERHALGAFVDQQGSNGTADVHMVIYPEGRVGASILDKDGDLDPLAEPAVVTVEPVSEIEYEFSSEFDLRLSPEFEDEGEYRLLVWYDADADDALDIGITEDSETVRPLTSTSEGHTYTIVSLELEMTGYRAGSESRFVRLWQSDGSGITPVDEDWPEPWRATIGTQTEPPR